MKGIAALLGVSSIGLVLAAARPVSGAGGTRYAEDLAAFFKEMDGAYPFFDLKGIRGGWAPFKTLLAKRAARCASDREFLGLVIETITFLRDGHMGIVKSTVEPPSAAPEWYPGLSFLPAAGGRVIVLDAGERLGKDVPPGTIVEGIDGKPARAWLEARAKASWERGGPFSSPARAALFEYRIPLRGKKGDKHKLVFLDGKKKKSLTVVCDQEARGWPHTYNMPDGLTAHGKSCRHGTLPGGAGYIHLRAIGPDTEAGIAAAVAAAPDAKGWIIDLRGNGGGGYDERLVKRVAALPRPVVGIIDAGCVSAGETFARDLVAGAGARLIGTPTAGSSSAKRTWEFPSGIATLSIPTRSRFGPDRRPIEFFGIRPHEEVEAVAEEVRKGLNSEILRAEKLILDGAGRTP